jgi:hypothetical protein
MVFIGKLRQLLIVREFSLRCSIHLHSEKYSKQFTIEIKKKLNFFSSSHPAEEAALKKGA